MPIYEYRCENCGHVLEALQRINDDPLSDCPACDAAKLKKLVSAAGFRLKGGGWYETDFKSGGKRNLVESEKKAEGSEKTKDKGEKPASKDAAKPATETKSKPKDSANNSAAGAA